MAPGRRNHAPLSLSLEKDRLRRFVLVFLVLFHKTFIRTPTPIGRHADGYAASHTLRPAFRKQLSRELRILTNDSLS